MRKYIIVQDKENDAWCVCLEGSGADAAFYYDWASGTYTEAQAKERAEAECDRLNEEYRKAQNND